MSGEPEVMGVLRAHTLAWDALYNADERYVCLASDVLAAYDTKRAERDGSYKAHEYMARALAGVLGGEPCTTFANLLAPDQYDLAEQVAAMVQERDALVNDANEWRSRQDEYRALLAQESTILTALQACEAERDALVKQCQHVLATLERENPSLDMPVLLALIPLNAIVAKHTQPPEAL